MATSPPELSHLDEHGQPCSRHPAPSSDELMALALVGSRAPSFHHDLASKLQGLMMAVDEISEVSGEIPPPVMRAIDTAHGALREVLALLNNARALTKPPVSTRIALADLLARSAERVYVTLRDTPTAAFVSVPVPAMVHALSLVLDVAGGPGRGRTVSATISVADGVATVELGASEEPPSNAGSVIALAQFVLAGSDGSVRCAADGSKLVLRLPVTI